jgi:hypothetical protein
VFGVVTNLHVARARLFRGFFGKAVATATALELGIAQRCLGRSLRKADPRKGRVAK